MTETNAIPLTTLFKGTIPKHPEFPEANEDKLRACDSRQMYIISDGASESYNSTLWAEIIVAAWYASPPRRRFSQWLRRAIAEYELRTNVAAMSWSQEAAFERGSFASLLAINWHSQTLLRVTAVGDSEVLIVRDGEIKWAFPYDHADRFRERPNLLSTILGKNLGPFFRQAIKAVLADRSDGPCHADVPLLELNDRMLCVTDALGEWLLRDSVDHKDRLSSVLNLTSDDEFSSLVENARLSGTMRRDDTTLLTLGLARNGIAHA